MKKPPYHKRQPDLSARGPAFARALRSARDAMNAGRHKECLAELDKLANQSRGDLEKARITLLVAESQAVLGRYADAAAAFNQAGGFAKRAADTHLAMRAGLGKIRSLLGTFQYEDAVKSATALLDEVEKDNASFDALTETTPGQLATQGRLLLAPRPPRPTVALTKVASAFLERGYTDEAKAFLEKVVITTPNGGARARQSLAKIALASDDPALAERYARESLQIGKFQAKTIAGWPLYIDARARQKLSPVLEPNLWESLKHNSEGRIWAASVWTIVRSLRAQGDPAWIDVANGYLSNPGGGDPVIGAEIEKILHAGNKMNPERDPAVIAAKSLALFQKADASPGELVAHAKEHVIFSLRAGQSPVLEPLLESSRKRFGRSHALKVRHAMALGAIKAQNAGMGVEMLLTLVAEQPAGTPGWGKALWSLALAQVSLGQTRQAAESYLALAANGRIPERFRVQATLRAFGLLEELDGEWMDIGKVQTSIRSIVTHSGDFRVVYDIARQLNLAGDIFRYLFAETAERGNVLASEFLRQETTPRGKLAILEYLARRQYYDTSELALIVRRWDKLEAPEMSEFRKCGGSIWYSYLSLVFLSLAGVGRKEDAVKLATDVLNGNRESSEGYVILGAVYANWLIIGKQYQAAMDCFEWISRESPKHRAAGAAHYWLALRASARGDRASAGAGATAARACFSGRPELDDERALECKSYLLLKDLNQPAVPMAYQPEFLERMQTELKYELAEIS